MLRLTTNTCAAAIGSRDSSFARYRLRIAMRPSNTLRARSNSIRNSLWRMTAWALDPGGFVGVSYNRAVIFMYQGKYDDAMREMDRAASVEPNNPLLRSIRALVMFYRGEVAAAANVLGEVLEQNPNLHGVRPAYAMCLSSLGQHDAALAELNDVVKRTASVDPDIAYAVTSVYGLEGKLDEAFEWLNRSIALGNENTAWFELDPTLASLRNDARFGEIIKQIKTSGPA